MLADKGMAVHFFNCFPKILGEPVVTPEFSMRYQDVYLNGTKIKRQCFYINIKIGQLILISK